MPTIHDDNEYKDNSFQKYLSSVCDRPGTAQGSLGDIQVCKMSPAAPAGHAQE